MDRLVQQDLATLDHPPSRQRGMLIEIAAEALVTLGLDEPGETLLAPVAQVLYSLCEKEEP